MIPLRKIGTEFEYVFPASMTSTDPRPYRMTYKVVGYDETERGRCESVKCIKSEALPAPTVIPFKAFQSPSHYYVWTCEYAEQFIRDKSQDQHHFLITG